MTRNLRGVQAVLDVCAVHVSTCPRGHMGKNFGTRSKAWDNLQIESRGRVANVLLAPIMATEMGDDNNDRRVMLLQRMQAHHVQAVWELEKASFPEDEGASRSTIAFRIAETGGLCQVYVDSGSKLAALMMCTASGNAGRMRAESIERHDAEGTTVCIHSVVVRKELRGRGIGLRMMREYMAGVRAVWPATRRLLLLTKAKKVAFYQRAGFHVVGESDIVLGRGRWVEMSFEFGPN